MNSSFTLESAPHDLGITATGRIMKILLLSLIPAVLVNIYLYGFGVLINILLCLVSCLVTEGILLRLRKRHLNLLWRDSSAAVTAVILGLALPQLLPWHLSVIGSVFAIALVKHAFGGLGQNIFNPAMAAFVFLLISSPVQMTSYVSPVPGNWNHLTFSRSAAIIFGNSAARDAARRETQRAILESLELPGDRHEYFRLADSFTGPTFLTDAMHERPVPSNPDASLQGWTEGALGTGSLPWLFIGHIATALAFLLGGLPLIVLRIIDWRIPVSFLSVTGALATVFWLANPDAFLSPLWHLVFGATIFGAFYIITDPVTAVPKPQGAWIFGATVAVFFVIIRNLGGYPDAMAFSVLLGNAAAPLISILTRRREFGAGSSPEVLHEHD